MSRTAALRALSAIAAIAATRALTPLPDGINAYEVGSARAAGGRAGAGRAKID